MSFFDTIVSLVSGDKKSKKHVPVSSQVKFIEEDDSEVEKTMQINLKPPKNQYVVKIDGEYYIYDDKEHMPPELRHEVEEVEHDEETSSTYTVFVDGERRNYSSLGEMPADLREAMIKNTPPQV